ncbi:MAG TPA: ABC transporter permease [Thermomicrobiales bacterium]|nr:ABC transporter permease [Thermomicrobiales bacterium]
MSTAATAITAESILSGDRLGKHVGEGYWAGAFRRLRANRIAAASAVFIILLTLTAVILPEVYPRSYATQNYDAVTQGPSWRFPMGTDQLGRDIFIRLVFGARISLTVGFVVQAVILVIGVPAGLVSGYFGGKIDTFLMRIVDVLYAMPSLLFIIILMTFLRGTLDNNPSGLWKAVANVDGKTGGLIGVYLGLGLIGWLTVSRIVRANTMSLKEREFAEAARSIGVPSGRIMFRHILPNTVAAIVVAATLGIPSAILAEAGISFLGIGVIPPMPSWGLMISESIQQMRVHPYMLIFPALALSLTVLAFNFLGDGLRDALDPWMRR